MNTEKHSRNANIELLRILSMIMVTFLHALGKSDLLRPLDGSLPLNGWIAWIFEALSIGAVNIFMLITGYFLIDSKFKISRLISLVLQTVFYTLGAFLVYFALGLLPNEERDIYHILQAVLPVHMEVFWFVTAYLILYMVMPLISAGIRALSQQQFGLMIILLVAFECLFISLLPVTLATDDFGYSFLWYMTMALIGAYFRIYEFKHLTKAVNGLLLYIAGVIGLLAETALIRAIYARTGRLEALLNNTLHYNQLFVLMLSVGIFAAIIKAGEIKGLPAKVICAVSPFTLGVYLFQENIVLRYRWQDWFGLRESFEDPTGLFILRLLGAVAAMFFIGIAVDAIRSLIFKAIGRICPRKD